MATSVGMSQARATPEQPAKITPQSILVTVIFSIAPPLPASETAPILPYRLRPRLWWREWELAAAVPRPGSSSQGDPSPGFDPSPSRRGTRPARGRGQSSFTAWEGENMRTTGPLVLTALLALPCGADAAYYFEANTRTEGDGKTEVVRVRGYVDGDKARIEAVEGAAMPFVESGSYLLTTGGGSSLYIVNPAEMTYSEMDLDQLLAMAGGVLNAASGVLNLSFTD